MATSFIDFNGKGFWIRDNILTLTLCFLHTKMSERDLPLWAVEFRRLIKENAIGNFYGFVDVELDKCLINVERRNWFMEVLDETKVTIQKSTGDPDFIKFYNGTIKSFEIADVNPDISRIIKVLEYLKKLVNNELTTIESDPIDYSF
jgi:hypothetical protein